MGRRTESGTHGVNVRTVQIDSETGIELLEHHGSGRKTAVLLLHGWGAGARCFHLGAEGFSTMDNLASRGLSVYAMEQRGYGNSTYVPGNVLRAAFAVGDVSTVMDFILAETGAERICLVGHSWGAMIAAMTAAERNDAVGSLVLIGMPYRRVNVPQEDTRESAETTALPSDGWIPNDTYAAVVSSLHQHNTAANAAYRELIGRYYRRLPIGAAQDIAELPHAAHCGRLACPTLLVRGALETLVDPEDALALLNDLTTPEKELTFVGCTGHNHVLEALGHAQVDRVVADWALRYT